MEEVERLPSAQSGGNQNALLQTARGTGDGARFRPPGRRAASARCHPQSLHPTRHADDGGYGLIPPGQRGITLSVYLCNKASSKTLLAEGFRLHNFYCSIKRFFTSSSGSSSNCL